MSATVKWHARPGFLAGAAIGFGALTYLVLFAEPEVLVFFAGKEMFLELLGSLFFLVASVLCFIAYARVRRHRTRPEYRSRLALLLLGFFFFVACGEELSWGQHILGFSPPEELRELNRQSEVNIHNLGFLDSYSADGERKKGLSALLTSNRLFDYFMISAFLLLPLADRRIPTVRRLIARLGIPVAPVLFALPLVFNLILTLVSELWIVDGRTSHLAVSEIREANYALLCLVGVFYISAVTIGSRAASAQSDLSEAGTTSRKAQRR